MQHSVAVVPVELQDGSVVRVEATVLGGREKVGVFEPRKLDEFLKSITAIGTAVQGELTHVRAEKATVEFGIEIGLESGGLTALICQGTAKANITVRLEWQRSDRPGGTDV